MSQRDGGRVGFAGVIRPGVPFPEKSSGIAWRKPYILCLTSPTKRGFPFSGKRVEQRVLRRVGILIFVDKDFIEPDGELLREREGRTAPSLPREVRRRRAPCSRSLKSSIRRFFFFFLVPGGKAADKREKGGHQTAQHVQILAALRLVPAQKGGKGSDQGLYIAAQGFDPFFGGLVPAGPRRLERRGSIPDKKSGRVSQSHSGDRRRASASSAACRSAASAGRYFSVSTALPSVRLIAEASRACACRRTPAIWRSTTSAQTVDRRGPAVA